MGCWVLKTHILSALLWIRNIDSLDINMILFARLVLIISINHPTLNIKGTCYELFSYKNNKTQHILGYCLQIENHNASCTFSLSNKISERIYILAWVVITQVTNYRTAVSNHTTCALNNNRWNSSYELQWHGTYEGKPRFFKVKWIHIRYIQRNIQNTKLMLEQQIKFYNQLGGIYGIHNINITLHAEKTMLQFF